MRGTKTGVLTKLLPKCPHLVAVGYQHNTAISDTHRYSGASIKPASLSHFLNRFIAGVAVLPFCGRYPTMQRRR
ncbi:hypothetical protein [Candidatus Symbiopectobacterium sp. 'North America']|uniref:hypothetical protein n=1 Tax=Candidatus Symbiopectobacterium sp. 'North America' TaxID=2794574 RepID=UPI0018C9005A|nr:hypothetical protein [Candidatus Symbiopectobacterium sp. 'North America']